MDRLGWNPFEQSSDQGSRLLYCGHSRTERCCIGANRTVAYKVFIDLTIQIITLLSNGKTRSHHHIFSSIISPQLPNPLFPLSSILNSLRNTLRSILKPSPTRAQRITNGLPRTTRCAGDSIPDAAGSGTRHAAHCARDAADGVAECRCNPFGGACCALVLRAVADRHDVFAFVRMDWLSDFR